MRVHHVVTAVADQAAQPEQRGHLGVPGHPQVADPAAVGADHVRDRPRVVERDDLAVVPGVLQDRAELEFGAADPQAGDHVQNLHVISPRRFFVMASAAMLVTVRASTTRSSQNDQCSM